MAQNKEINTENGKIKIGQLKFLADLFLVLECKMEKINLVFQLLS